MSVRLHSSEFRKLTRTPFKEAALALMDEFESAGLPTDDVIWDDTERYNSFSAGGALCVGDARVHFQVYRNGESYDLQINTLHTGGLTTAQAVQILNVLDRK